MILPGPRRSPVDGLPVTGVLRTIFDCLTLLDDGACAALVDHATATLTSDQVLRRRYLEEVGLRGSSRLRSSLHRWCPVRRRLPSGSWPRACAQRA